MKDPMYRTIRTIAPFLLMMGCAPAVEVTTDHDSTAEFGTYRTYGFYQEQPVAQHDSNVQGLDPAVDTKIRSAVRDAMGVEGLQYAASSPDLKVAYDISLDTELYTNTNYTYPAGFGYGYGYWYGYRYDYGLTRFPNTYRTIDTYKEGTIVIDLVDAASNELVWRGVGEASVDPSGDVDQARINSIVMAIMERFPPE